MGWMRQRTLGVTGALLLGAGIAVLAGGPATPAAWGGSGTCAELGPVVVDFTGRGFRTHYCHNFLGGDVRDGGSVGELSTGYLYAGTNWFACQALGDPNPPVGNATNHYRLYTQGDTGTPDRLGWGWFPATYISEGGNEEPIPGIPSC